MRRGEQSVNTKLIFSRKEGVHKNVGFMGIDAEFYEADINVDAIIGCPWLVKKRVGVLAYLKALTVERDSNHLDLLWSMEGERERRKKRKPKGRQETPIFRVSARRVPLINQKVEAWLKETKLSIPQIGEDGSDALLNDEEMERVVQHLMENDCVKVDTVVLAKGDCAEENLRVKKMQEKIHKDYDWGSCARRSSRIRTNGGSMVLRLYRSRQGRCRTGKRHLGSLGRKMTPWLK